MRRQLTIATAASAVLVMASGLASAAWNKGGTGAGTGRADTMPAAGATTITSGTSTTAPLSWPARSLSGVAVDGHVVSRSNVMTSTTTAVASGPCAGVVAANSCSDSPSVAATYTWSVEPKLGLWVGAAGSSSGELNIGAPAPVGVATTGNADGNIDSGETLSVTFNQRMKASTLCSGWNTNTGNFSISGNNTNLAFTIGNNNAPGTSNDTVSISNGSTTCGTSAFGTFDLGSNGYVSATKNCTGNGGSAQGLSWSGATATMTLTFNSCTTSTVGASQIKYTPSTSAQNSSGTALLATATATSASVQQW